MSAGVTGFLLAVLAGTGVFLAWTGLVLGWRGLGPALTSRHRERLLPDLRGLLASAGLEQVGPREFLAADLLAAVLGGLVGWALFGGVLAPLALAGAAAWAPIGTAMRRRGMRREIAREAWPRLLEELRLQVVSRGRSVPQALLDVGMRGPEEFRPAFAEARRTWAMSTDFERTLDVLRARLAEPTADAVCETLLIAHEVGGTDVDARLRALVEDRVDDLEGRRDARAEQSGARFARMFVLVVPLGMAVVGLTIGQGRAAYQSPVGQLTVLAALTLLGICWVWASHMLALPDEERVFLGRLDEDAR